MSIKQLVNTKELLGGVILKRKVYHFIDEWVTGEYISAVLLLIILIICVRITDNIDKLKPTDLIDFSLIISFIILFISNVFSNVILKKIRRVCEDAAKLSTDYKDLTEKYKLSKLITTKLINISNDYDKKENNNCKSISSDENDIDNDCEYLPVEFICARKKSEEAYDIHFTNSLIHYQLPEQIANISAYLFKAHRESDIHNSRCFRLEKISKIDNEINMHISITSYYDSLLTNRVMDFIWPDGRSNREVYEPGPYISSLEDSKMSNHIGINGIIETKDEKFIFVKQSGKNSIGKNTIGTSIGTTLKAEYILKRDGSLVEDAVVKAIQREIKEELEVKDIEIKKENIVAIYRDLVEGGKPQILFYKKLEKEYEFKVEKPDERLIFIKRDTVMESEFKVDKIIMNKRPYSMMPSVVASIVLIKYHLDDTTPFPLQNTNRYKLTENIE